MAIEAAARAGRGQREGLEEALARATTLSEGDARWAMEGTVWGLAALVRIDLGEREQARELLERLERRVATRGWEPPGTLDVVLEVLRRALG
jgi:hypothetical protein